MRRRLAKQMLAEALAHFEVVAEYGEGDLTDQKTVDAICMRLSAGVSDRGNTALPDPGSVGSGSMLGRATEAASAATLWLTTSSVSTAYNRSSSVPMAVTLPAQSFGKPVPPGSTERQPRRPLIASWR